MVAHSFKKAKDAVCLDWKDSKVLFLMRLAPLCRQTGRKAIPAVESVANHSRNARLPRRRGLECFVYAVGSARCAVDGKERVVFQRVADKERVICQELLW